MFFSVQFPGGQCDRPTFWNCLPTSFSIGVFAVGSILYAINNAFLNFVCFSKLTCSLADASICEFLIKPSDENSNDF